MERTIEDTGAGVRMEAERIQVDATNIAGRDIYVEENNYYDSKSGFAEINLSAYSSEHYPVPQFSAALEERLRTSRLLLITGSYGFDKETFARHLSYRLSATNPQLKAREWNEPVDGITDLAKTLREEGVPSIFLLTRVGPKAVDFDLEKVRLSVEQRGHYLLLTSDLSIESWQQPQQVLQRHWFEIPDHDLYTQETLTNILLNLVTKRKSEMSLEVEMGVIGVNTQFTRKHTLRELAQTFRTPEEITFFIDSLTLEKKLLTAERLDELLTEFKDRKESIIVKWFKGLNEREKMLTLGAAMFEGLYEDQFFQVMDRMIKDFWHHKSPDLLGLDYVDLEFAMNFFKFEEYGDSISVFKGRFPNQRPDIIRAAWNSHRRHIVLCLPILVQVGRQSSMGGAMNKGIFSSRERGMTLRSMIAELFSDIAMQSLKLVEEQLLEFAIYSESTLQRVTAKALARWREYGKDDLLFATLRRWFNDPKMRAKVANLRAGEGASTYDGRYLTTTLFRALGYSAGYDSRNKVHPELLKILEEAMGTSANRRNAQLGTLIGELIERHPDQMTQLLPERFMIYAELEEAVLEGLIQLHEREPENVGTFIRNWCSKQLDQGDSGEAHEQVVSVFLNLMQQLLYIKSTALTTGYVWSVVQHLYVRNSGHRIRYKLGKVVGALISVSPEDALDPLSKMFEYAGLSDREELLMAFVSVYKDQRKQLTGAEYEVSVNGVTYPSYVNSTRPLTDIEQTLYRWLNMENEFGRQLALLTFIQFARKFDIQISRLQPQRIVTLESAAQARADFENSTNRYESDSYPQYHQVTEISWFDRLRIWFWLLFETPENRVLFRSLLNAVLEHRELFSNEDLVYVISRFMGQQQEPYSRMGRWMEKWLRTLLR